MAPSRVVAGALLVAAVPAELPPAVVLAALRVQDEAVLRIGERLAVAGRPFCRDQAYSAGITVQRLGQYGARFRPAAAALLKLAEAPTVAIVNPGSAAEEAGVRPGDVLASVDGDAVPVVPNRGDSGEYRGTARALDQMDAALADGIVRLNVLREGQPLALVLTGRLACRARFDVRAGGGSNATADGLTIQVSSKLVADARGDGELAAILAHELAHNILRHPRRLKSKERGLSVRQTEVEADQLSVYLLDAAGYAPADAIAFWSRWGRANDLGIFSDRTHPGWRKRADAIAAEAASIATRRAAGQPALPPPALLP
jgi:hypothetical protein